MKKLVKESFRSDQEERPEYYPADENNSYASKYEPWTLKPETNEIMESMLDKYEKTNSIDESMDYDTVWLIKWALWVGYNFK